MMDAAHNKLTDEAAREFSKHTWDNLVSFHFGRNELTDAGVVALMKVKYPELKSLWIGTRVATQTTIRTWATSPLGP